MNLLARAKFSAHFIFPTPSPAKRLFNLQPAAAVLQHFNLYATKASSAYTTSKTQQLTKPRTQKSSEPSSSTFSQRIRKQTEALATVWPKPREIPYQEKVANFVNLIGYIKAPVQFEATSDGTHFAATVISQENGNEKNSLLIPIVFEGDLAHVVACHVKENDCVFVSGQLSVDPMRLVLSDKSLGKFHVLAENLNFVDKKNAPEKKIGVSLSYSAFEIEKPVNSVAEKIEPALEKVDSDEDFKQQWKGALEHATGKRVSAVYTPGAIAEASPSVESIRGGEEIKNEKSGESGNNKKKSDDQMHLWRDLVKNPLQWWDYRSHKANGLVKERFPDFKQKVSGESLWLTTAPDWVLPGIGKLEFDVKNMQPRQVQVVEGAGDGTKTGKSEPTWKNLVENPDKWWDNRANKRNPKQPDFKHKETGEVLWIDRLPAWALSQLPPLKDGLTAFDAKKNLSQ